MGPNGRTLYEIGGGCQPAGVRLRFPREFRENSSGTVLTRGVPLTEITESDRDSPDRGNLKEKPRNDLRLLGGNAGASFAGDGRLLFGLDRRVNLTAVNRNLAGSLNAKTDLVATDFDHRDHNVVVNDDALVLLARQNQHGGHRSKGASRTPVIGFCRLANRKPPRPVVPSGGRPIRKTRSHNRILARLRAEVKPSHAMRWKGGFPASAHRKTCPWPAWAVNGTYGLRARHWSAVRSVHRGFIPGRVTPCPSAPSAAGP